MIASTQRVRCAVLNSCRYLRRTAFESGVNHAPKSREDIVGESGLAGATAPSGACWEFSERPLASRVETRDTKLATKFFFRDEPIVNILALSTAALQIKFVGAGLNLLFRRAWFLSP